MLAVVRPQVAGSVRAVLVATLLALAATSVQLSAPRQALASDGYHETATSTYTVNPAAGRLDVALDVVFKNTTKSTSTTYFYYDAVYVWLEHAAAHVQVSTDGGGASIVRDKTGTAYDRWVVRLGRSIFYGGTRRIHVTYRLAGGAPRSTSDVRVNPAFASFCVVAFGDDGGTARVVAPAGYQMSIDGEGGTLTPTITGSGTVWTTGPLTDPYSFWACFNGTNPAGYVETPVTSPSGQKIDIESWPNDQTWQTEVKGEVDGTLAKLETLVGRGLTSSGTIVVREVGTGELSGYAAFFDPTTGIAIVGEDYGSGGTVVHELSHAWFNDSLFDDRWMAEGMAEWARISTVTDYCLDPGAPSGGARADLQHWVFAGPRSTKAETDMVDWEYQAACFIVKTLSDKAGQDGMRTALGAMFDRKLAYQSGGIVLDGKSGAQGWRQWLDAVDELGLVPAGVTDLDFAQKLLARFGAAPAGPELDNRSKARATYHQLAGSIGDWTIPEAVLRPMGSWQFGDATVAMGDVSKAFATLAEADTALADLDAVDGPVKDLVEKAKTEADLQAATKEADDELAAAKAVADAQARLDAPRDLFTTIGLLGTDPSVSLPAAKAAAAAADLDGTTTQVALITSVLSGASQQGLTRVAIVVIVTVAVLLVLAFVVRRRRRAAAQRTLALAAASAAAASEPALPVAGDANLASVPVPDGMPAPPAEDPPAPAPPAVATSGDAGPSTPST